MIKVEKFGPNTVKAIACEHCKSILSYTEADEDSLGGEKFIVCPVCDVAVFVTGNSHTLEDFTEAESFFMDDPLTETDPGYLAELNATSGKL